MGKLSQYLEKKKKIGQKDRQVTGNLFHMMHKNVRVEESEEMVRFKGQDGVRRQMGQKKSDVTEK